VYCIYSTLFLIISRSISTTKKGYFLLMRGVFCFSHLQFRKFTLAELKEFYILALGSVVLSKLQDSGHLHV
jgi:hypothetical protein